MVLQYHLMIFVNRMLLWPFNLQLSCFVTGVSCTAEPVVEKVVASLPQLSGVLVHCTVGDRTTYVSLMLTLLLFYCHLTQVERPQQPIPNQFWSQADWCTNPHPMENGMPCTNRKPPLTSLFYVMLNLYHLLFSPLFLSQSKRLGPEQCAQEELVKILFEDDWVTKPMSSTSDWVEM